MKSEGMRGVSVLQAHFLLLYVESEDRLKCHAGKQEK